MKILGLLVLAACLEVGGDAFIRSALHGTSKLGYGLGALFLVTYGVMVNLPGWDFGKLLGLYIVLFFIISQLTGVLIFSESIPLSRVIGGALVLSGGLVMAFWK